MTGFNLVASDFYKIVTRYTGRQGARQAQIIEQMSGKYEEVVSRIADINTFNRHKHFLAQISMESWGLSLTQELGSGAEYEGRKDLGNTTRGDGARYKGRGLIEITGRYNMAVYGKQLNLDLLAHPELLDEWPHYLAVSAMYWKDRGINRHADADDLVACTRLVNGGTNGLGDRRGYLARAKLMLNYHLARPALPQINALGFSTQPTLTNLTNLAHPLYRGMPPAYAVSGSQEDDVTSLQRNLAAHGVALTVDGEYGPATELAVKQFQSAVGLPITGIVDTRTWCEAMARP